MRSESRHPAGKSVALAILTNISSRPKFGAWLRSVQVILRPALHQDVEVLHRQSGRDLERLHVTVGRLNPELLGRRFVVDDSVAALSADFEHLWVLVCEEGYDHL